MNKIKTTQNARPMTVLVPEEVGRREQILLPATIRENVFSSWSGLVVSNRFLKESLKLFKGTEGHDGKECKFVVTLHAKMATAKEVVFAKLGVGSNLLVGTGYGSGGTIELCARRINSTSNVACRGPLGKTCSEPS